MLKVTILPTTDKSLETWSYSRLNDYSTCETYGHVRGAFRKTFPRVGRALALEAGSAAHDAFAAFRLYKLLEDGHDNLFEFHTHRIFGPEKGAALVARVRRGSDGLLNAISFATDALHMSGYYDDPMDRRRTLANIEEALHVYCKSIYGRQNPVYIQDVADPASLVGIELPFDFTLRMQYNDEAAHLIRYIGTIDAVHISKQGKPYIEENKTASRLGDAWSASFETSHQVTGYCAFGSALTGEHIREAMVRGVALPQPRKQTTWSDGVRGEYVTRSEDQIAKFFQWVYQTYMKRVRIGDDIEEALQETHSCNRYFQACSLIPFCKGSAEERQDILDTMVTMELSPSEQAVADKSGE